MKYEQGAMDALMAARNALDGAIKHYIDCQGEEGEENLTLDEGPLFAAHDFADTVEAEMAEFRILSKGPPQPLNNSWIEGD